MRQSLLLLALLVSGSATAQPQPQTPRPADDSNEGMVPVVTETEEDPMQRPEIDRPMQHGRTQLMQAAMAGDGKSVASLLERGASTEATTKDGQTALLRRRQGPARHRAQAACRQR